MEKENTIPANPANPFDPMDSTDSMNSTDSTNSTDPIDAKINSNKEFSPIDNSEIIQNVTNNESPDSKGVQKDGLDISKVRERTFNKELGDLVDRIKSNEPVKDGSPASAAAVEEITEDDLLQMFHQLFYKSVNITGLNHIDTNFNPFDLYKELSSDDLVSLIYNEMSGLSFNEYSILTFAPEKNCYSCYINHITDINENNLIIDPSEALYKNIIDNKYGNILDRQSIERDIYYKKRFSGENSLFFMSIGGFFRDYYSNADLININDFSDAFFPILVIRVRENMGENRKKSIYRLIKDKFTLYFFLLYRKITLERQNTNPVNLQSIYEFLDYTYQRYDKYKECVCSVIKCKKYVNIESLFIIRYLHSKLKKKLDGAAEVIRIEKDKLIVFTLKSKRKMMDDILDDLNKIYSDLFRIETFTDDGIRPIGSILQNIKEYLIK